MLLCWYSACLKYPKLWVRVLQYRINPRCGRAHLQFQQPQGGHLSLQSFWSFEDSLEYIRPCFKINK